MVVDYWLWVLLCLFVLVVCVLVCSCLVVVFDCLVDVLLVVWYCCGVWLVGALLVAAAAAAYVLVLRWWRCVCGVVVVGIVM